MKRVVFITGSRKWADRQAIADAIEERGADLIVHGGCPTGADQIAHELARQFGIIAIPVQAYWDQQKKTAGPIRNSLLAKLAAWFHELGCDVTCYGFPLPGGTGTQDCIRKMKLAGIECVVKGNWNAQDR